jgi:lysophospholipase L1-like esterase
MWKRLLVCAAAFFICSQAIAQTSAFGGASSPDPNLMPEMPNTVAGNSTYSGRTQVSPVLVGGENTGVILVLGDSTGSNVVNSIFTPVNTTKNQNLNPYNGGVYQSVEPLLGCTTNQALPASGNFFTRVADTLITNAVYARVIVEPISVSGTLFADWAVGGAINGRIAAAYKRMTAVGLTPTGIYIMLGVNDTNAGTGQIAATASLNSIISTIRALNSTVPIFVPKHSIFGLVTSAAVQNAQAAVLDSPGKVYSGGDMDTLTAAGNYWDNTHFNATGAAAAAALAVTAITAHP